MDKRPLDPSNVYNLLLHFNTRQFQCIEQNALPTSGLKQCLKRQINEMNSIKKCYLDLLQKKKQLNYELQQLLNYRQSIDYDQKYKMLQYDHYSFPYRDNNTIQTQLQNIRIQNLQTRRKINQLQIQFKQKNQKFQNNKHRNIKFQFDEIKKSHQNIQRSKNQQNLFWINRMENIKKKYQNQDKEFRYAKVRHDYNLLVDKYNCKCIGKKSCSICSNFSIDFPNSYCKQALLSPRYNGYRSIYKQNC